MKRTLLFFFALIINIAVTAQTIRRVSNIPGSAVGTNTYTTINSAILASSDDDIIYIEPSQTFYSGFTVNKRLHFIGNGNFLTQNPGTPNNKNLTRIYDFVYFNAGSSGSSIRGVYLNGIVAVKDADGIQFVGNRIASIEFKESTSGNLIAENYLDGDLRSLEGNVPPATTSGQSTTIRNNIITGMIISFRNSSIFNNTISGANGYFSVFVNLGCQINNNLIDFRMYADSPIPDYVAPNEGSSAINNLQILAPGATIPASTTNYFTTDAANVFEIGATAPWGLDKDAVFKLKPGSPALEVGPDNVQVGAFGGASPYKLSGLPNVPIVTSAFTSGTGNNTAPLQVKVTIHSN